MANLLSLSCNSDAKYKLLLDADILEEAVLNRGCFIKDVENLLTALNSDSICLYIAERGLNRLVLNYDEDTANYFRHLFDGRILPTSDSIKEKARRLNFADYESAIEHVCATELNLDAIVTLNPSNFSESCVPVWTAVDWEQRILLESILTIDVQTIDVQTIDVQTIVWTIYVQWFTFSEGEFLIGIIGVFSSGKMIIGIIGVFSSGKMIIPDRPNYDGDATYNKNSVISGDISYNDASYSGSAWLPPAYSDSAWLPPADLENARWFTAVVIAFMDAMMKRRIIHNHPISGVEHRNEASF